MEIGTPEKKSDQMNLSLTKLFINFVKQLRERVRITSNRRTHQGNR
jgi:hypothetical protein